MQKPASRGWAGVDVGKGHHWVCLIDEAGTILWSAKVVNDEGAILEAVGAVLARAEQVVRAVDVTGTMSGLLLALLAAHGQQVKYVPWRTANQMAVAYRGEAKTDAAMPTSSPRPSGTAAIWPRWKSPPRVGDRAAVVGGSPHRPGR